MSGRDTRRHPPAIPHGCPCNAGTAPGATTAALLPDSGCTSHDPEAESGTPDPGNSTQEPLHHPSARDTACSPNQQRLPWPPLGSPSGIFPVRQDRRRARRASLASAEPLDREIRPALLRRRIYPTTLQIGKKSGGGHEITRPSTSMLGWAVRSIPDPSSPWWL